MEAATYHAKICRTHRFEWWVEIHEDDSAYYKSLHLVWGTRGMANRCALKQLRNASTRDRFGRRLPSESYEIRPS